MKQKEQFVPHLLKINNLLKAKVIFRWMLPNYSLICLIIIKKIKIIKMFSFLIQKQSFTKQIAVPWSVIDKFSRSANCVNSLRQSPRIHLYITQTSRRLVSQAINLFRRLRRVHNSRLDNSRPLCTKTSWKVGYNKYCKLNPLNVSSLRIHKFISIINVQIIPLNNFFKLP